MIREQAASLRGEVDRALGQGKSPRDWPEPLQRTYAQVREDRHFTEGRFYILLGMVLTLATLVVDALAMPDHLAKATFNRLFYVVPLQFAALLVPRRFPRAQKLLMCLSIIAFAAVLMRGVAWAQPPIDGFLMMGTVLLLGAALPALPLTTREALGFAAAYVVATGWAMHVYVQQLASHMPFLAILVLTALASAVLLRRNRWLEERAFLLAQQGELHLQHMEASNALLGELSQRDPLTGLANRRHAETLFARHYRSAPVVGEARVATMMIDLDHFKAFNDRWGHQTGDECLIAVAEAMRHSADGNGGIAARFGGEEFVLLLRVDSPRHAVALGEALRVAIERIEIRHRTSGDTATCTASIGIAVHREDAAPRLAPLLAEADSALYRAKRGGRNRCELARGDTNGVGTR